MKYHGGGGDEIDPRAREIIGMDPAAVGGATTQAASVGMDAATALAVEHATGLCLSGGASDGDYQPSVGSFEIVQPHARTREIVRWLRLGGVDRAGMEGVPAVLVTAPTAARRIGNRPSPLMAAVAEASVNPELRDLLARAMGETRERHPVSVRRIGGDDGGRRSLERIAAFIGPGALARRAGIGVEEIMARMRDMNPGAIEAGRQLHGHIVETVTNGTGAFSGIDENGADTEVCDGEYDWWCAGCGAPRIVRDAPLTAVQAVTEACVHIRMEIEDVLRRDADGGV